MFAIDVRNGKHHKLNIWVTLFHECAAVSEKQTEVNNENWKDLRKQMKDRQISEFHYSCFWSQRRVEILRNLQGHS